MKNRLPALCNSCNSQRFQWRLARLARVAEACNAANAHSMAHIPQSGVNVEGLESFLIAG
jgi:hypothetical protein